MWIREGHGTQFILVWIKRTRWRPQILIIVEAIFPISLVKTKKKERSWVQKFPQILVFVSKFLRIFTNSSVKTKKKEIFSSKISTNSGFRLKILAIFQEFLSEHQSKTKNKVFIPKLSWNPVWIHKNYKNSGGKHQFGSLRPRFAFQ